MARTLYLENGKTEYVFTNAEDELRRIIYENLGRDCEELLDDVLEEARHPYEDFDDYEEACEQYRSMCIEAMENFEQAIKYLDARKLDKKQLMTHLQLSRKLLA